MTAQQPPGGGHQQGQGDSGQGSSGGGGQGSSSGGGHVPGDYSRFPVDATPGFNEWQPVEVPAFGTGGYDQPFRLEAIALKSSSRQSEVFIHDPVRALTGRSAGRDSYEGDGFRGSPLLTEDPPRVNSTVIRHERTLEHMVVRAVALVDDDGSVTLVIHKHEGR